MCCLPGAPETESTAAGVCSGRVTSVVTRRRVEYKAGREAMAAIDRDASMFKDRVGKVVCVPAKRKSAIDNPPLSLTL